MPWPTGIPGWTLAATLLLDLVAILTIWTAPKHSRKSKTLWTVIVLILPIAGALGWFLLGHERRRRRK
jgi:hypothetical protein